MPAIWRETVTRWRDLNRALKPVMGASSAPDANDEYFHYQTLVGVWESREVPNALEPEVSRRISDYMLKALRESKRHTLWTDTNEEYERATLQFVAAMLDHRNNARFIQDLESFTGCIAFFGRINSVAQLLLKLTAPGVPDLYQGTEFWDLSLVDPDNRFPVDFSIRARVLEEVRHITNADDTSDLFAKEDGRVKLFTIFKALQVRNARSALFADGEYIPLAVHGPAAEHAFAFARQADGEFALIVVPRLVQTLMRGEMRLPLGDVVWSGTAVHLPDGVPARLVNAITGERVQVQNSELRLGQLFRSFPAALLVNG